MTVPLLWPREGASGHDLAAALRDVDNKATNVPMPEVPAVHAYGEWATASVATLRPWLRAEDVERLIRTPTYWAALAMPVNASNATRLVSEEMLSRRQELQRHHHLSGGSGPALPRRLPDTLDRAGYQRATGAPRTTD